MNSQSRMYDVGGVLLARPFKARRLGHFALWQTDLEWRAGSMSTCSDFVTPTQSSATAIRWQCSPRMGPITIRSPPFTPRPPRASARRTMRTACSSNQNLVPGRHARGGRQRPRVFRAAAGDHQPARPRFSRQQLGALCARSRRAPHRVLLRHGADRLGSPQQAGGGLSARGAQRLYASAARRDDRDHELRAQRHRPRRRIPSHRGLALRLLRRRRDVAAAVQGHQDRADQAVRLRYRCIRALLHRAPRPDQDRGGRLSRPPLRLSPLRRRASQHRPVPDGVAPGVRPRCLRHADEHRRCRSRPTDS